MSPTRFVKPQPAPATSAAAPPMPTRPVAAPAPAPAPERTIVVTVSRDSGYQSTPTSKAFPESQLRFHSKADLDLFYRTHFARPGDSGSTFDSFKVTTEENGYQALPFTAVLCDDLHPQMKASSHWKFELVSDHPLLSSSFSSQPPVSKNDIAELQRLVVGLRRDLRNEQHANATKAERTAAAKAEELMGDMQKSIVNTLHQNLNKLVTGQVEGMKKSATDALLKDMDKLVADKVEDVKKVLLESVDERMDKLAADKKAAKEKKAEAKAAKKSAVSDSATTCSMSFKLDKPDVFPFTDGSGLARIVGQLPLHVCAMLGALSEVPEIKNINGTVATIKKRGFFFELTAQIKFSQWSNEWLCSWGKCVKVPPKQYPPMMMPVSVAGPYPRDLDMKHSPSYYSNRGMPVATAGGLPLNTDTLEAEKAEAKAKAEAETKTGAETETETDTEPDTQPSPEKPSPRYTPTKAVSMAGRLSKSSPSNPPRNMPTPVMKPHTPRKLPSMAALAAMGRLSKSSPSNPPRNMPTPVAAPLSRASASPSPRIGCFKDVPPGLSGAQEEIPWTVKVDTPSAKPDPHPVSDSDAFVCDYCLEPIELARFHCQSCVDFDVCSSCYPSRAKSHSQKHGFVQYDVKTGAPIVTETETETETETPASSSSGDISTSSVRFPILDSVSSSTTVAAVTPEGRGSNEGSSRSPTRSAHSAVSSRSQSQSSFADVNEDDLLSDIGSYEHVSSDYPDYSDFEEHF